MVKQKSISIIGIIVAIAIIISVISLYYNQNTHKDEPRWVTSGPFSINKSQYKIGESVFIVVEGLKPNEAGNILIYKPNGKIYRDIPFNGTLKSAFKQYFTPNTSKVLGILTPQDLVGTWKVEFKGVSYYPLSFEILNEMLPGAENYVKPVENINSAK
jgi:hypothetical protein